MTKIQTLPRQIQAFPADALIVSHIEGSDTLSGPAASLDVALGASDGVPGNGPISKLLALRDFSGKPNELAVIYTNGLIPAPRVIVVGLGKAADLNPERVRQASGVAARKAQEMGCARVATAVHGAGSGGLNAREAAQATVEGAMLGAYQFNEFRTTTAAKSAVAELAVLEPARDRMDDVRAGVTAGEILANAQNAARDLINRPPDALHPASLAAWCVAMAKRVGLRCTVLGLAEIRKLGMGGVMGVCQGSKHQPRFVVLEHKPARAGKAAPLIFVGKGVTFDTGGYSIKSNDGMVGMKGDMAGAAAVIGAMQAIAQLKLQRHVIGITPLVENMISAEAFRPNDVLKMMNGMTVEITSTDAEGRLILADALHYAKRYKPQRVVDLATLTGTASIAMGRGLASTVHTNNEAWSRDIVAAGARAGERIWPMPIWPEHLERMRSDTADLKNGAQDMYAGLGSSAAFIREFTLAADGGPAYDWAHLDMAPMSLTKEVRGYQPKGGMGFGVRTLVNLVI